jgi:hypothetical protein
MSKNNVFGAGTYAGGAGTNALEFLQSIYRNPMEATSTRIRAAVEALPYENPKLSAVAFMHEADTFAERLERALERSSRAKLIELRPNPADER